MSEEFRTRIALTLQRKFLKMLRSSKIFPVGRYDGAASTTISRSQFRHCHNVRANDTRYNSRVPTKTYYNVSHNRPHVTLAEFLLAQIHADLYTRECCDCAVTWFIASQDYHSLSEQKSASLLWPLSVFFLRILATFLSGLWLSAMVYETNLGFVIVHKNCNVYIKDQDRLIINNSHQ